MRGLQDASDSGDRPAHARWLDRLRTMPETIANRYYRLSRRNKAIFFGLIIINIIIVIAIIIITPRRIAQALNDFAVGVRGMGVWGMLLAISLVVIASHPPLFGFSASMSLIGFAFGMWPGVLLAFIGSMSGAGIAFLSVRRFFPGLVRPNKKWDAFGRVMRDKGLLLVCMIRYCPIPWAIGNGLFASIDSISFGQFMIASVVYFPRLLIPVFIGSRLTSLSDPNAPHDPAHTWLNVLSIGLSLCVSAGTGVWIYRLTLRQMKAYEGGGDDAVDGLEEGLLAAAYADELAGEDDSERVVPRPKAGRSGSRFDFGFGSVGHSGLGRRREEGEEGEEMVLSPTGGETGRELGEEEDGEGQLMVGPSYGGRVKGKGSAVRRSSSQTSSPELGFRA